MIEELNQTSEPLPLTLTPLTLNPLKKHIANSHVICYSDWFANLTRFRTCFPVLSPESRRQGGQRRWKNRKREKKINGSHYNEGTS